MIRPEDNGFGSVPSNFQQRLPVRLDARDAECCGGEGTKESCDNIAGSEASVAIGSEGKMPRVQLMRLHRPPPFACNLSNVT